jgi:hypothetical protein
MSRRWQQQVASGQGEENRMSGRVDPNLMKDMKAFGLRDAGRCYNCGVQLYRHLSPCDSRKSVSQTDGKVFSVGAESETPGIS